MKEGWSPGDFRVVGQEHQVSMGAGREALNRQQVNAESSTGCRAAKDRTRNCQVKTQKLAVHNSQVGSSYSHTKCYWSITYTQV